MFIRPSHSINIFKSSTLQTKEMEKNQGKQKNDCNSNICCRTCLPFLCLPSNNRYKKRNDHFSLLMLAHYLKISDVVCFPSILPIKWPERNCGTQYKVPRINELKCTSFDFIKKASASCFITCENPSHSILFLLSKSLSWMSGISCQLVTG